jgi:hypothetical protein
MDSLNGEVSRACSRGCGRWLGLSGLDQVELEIPNATSLAEGGQT